MPRGPVYILTEEDFEQLMTMVDRDPAHGEQGGSSASYSEKDRMIYSQAHRFYNYQVRTWVERMKGH